MEITFNLTVPFFRFDHYISFFCFYHVNMSGPVWYEVSNNQNINSGGIVSNHSHFIMRAVPFSFFPYCFISPVMFPSKISNIFLTTNSRTRTQEKEKSYTYIMQMIDCFFGCSIWKTSNFSNKCFFNSKSKTCLS